jgi:hypothetical protein
MFHDGPPFETCDRRDSTGIKIMTDCMVRPARRYRWTGVVVAMSIMAFNTAGATNQFDFGSAGTEPGYVAVDNVTTNWGALGYGWLSTNGLMLRDRGVPDALHRDFIFKNTSGTNGFRVAGLTPNGKYLLKVTCGDAEFGDHVITVSVPGAGALPTMSPGASEFETLTASVDANGSGILDISFGSPINNWVVNALTLTPSTTNITPFIESNYIFANEWDPAVFAADPTTNLLSRFDGTGAVGFTPTGLTRSNYLTLIASGIDFWKTKQNSSGAIIDPYAGSEIQYSTPAFAHAAAVLVVYAGRNDLLGPATNAMNWAASRLHDGLAAGGHDDFYPGMLANTYRLLAPQVAPSVAAMWAADLDFDPYAIYNFAPGSFNWNVVSSSGEALLQLMGLRSTNNPYVTASWAAQGRHFTSPYGLYEEGPMAYDHFPRIWFEDALAQGYAGPNSGDVAEAMDRAAITSLFMQSPWGELPAGGRSAHHQWNEAEQCVTYEIYAAKAEAAGDLILAGAYKRGAHLALASMQRWVRPSGEMQIVKNWVDPSARHAYESYSYHSQYNLLPLAMLAMAYEHAAPTEDVTESPAPADTGGFLFQLTGLHKVFANAGGTYVEIDTTADGDYDATGLIRIHQRGVPPQLGPSDSLLAGASYTSPNPSPITTGVGVSWKDSGGVWRTLGEMGGTQITSVTVTPVSQSTTQVVFDVVYAGNLPNVSSITEHYVVTPSGVQLTTQLSGYSGPLRYVWPVLASDGRTLSSIAVSSNNVSVSQGGPGVIFSAPSATNVSVGTADYSNHNGWKRLATAEFPGGSPITLLISQGTNASVAPVPPFVANLVYVDATSGVAGNTALAAGGTFSPPLNVTNGLDNLWEERTVLGSGGNILESGGESPGFAENAPELRTTIAGLTPYATYKVYALFWDPTSTTEDWNIRAGFSASPGSNTLFSAADSTAELGGANAAVLAGGLSYSNPPSIFSESGRALLAGLVGTTMADGAGTIPVFIDDLPLPARTTVNQRTWYDGLAYAQVIAMTPTHIAAAKAGNQLVLSWPLDHIGWTLQIQTNSLSAGLTALSNAWHDVPGSSTVTNVMIVGSMPVSFFRLRSPQ